MFYTLKFSKRFDKEFEKLDKSVSMQFSNKTKKLKENPKFGRPLFYTNPVLWEIRIEMFRIFYVIDENNKEVRVLSIKHKDDCDRYIRSGYSSDLKV